MENTYISSNYNDMILTYSALNAISCRLNQDSYFQFWKCIYLKPSTTTLNNEPYFNLVENTLFPSNVDQLIVNFEVEKVENQDLLDLIFNDYFYFINQDLETIITTTDTKFDVHDLINIFNQKGDFLKKHFANIHYIMENTNDISPYDLQRHYIIALNSNDVKLLNILMEIELKNKSNIKKLPILTKVISDYWNLDNTIVVKLKGFIYTMVTKPEYQHLWNKPQKQLLEDMKMIKPNLIKTSIEK